MIYLSYIFLGIISGFLAGLLGIGGGVVIVPVLTYLFSLAAFSHEISIHMALATSLSSIFFTSSVASFSHFKFKNLDFNIIKSFIPFAVIGSIAGSFFATAVPSSYLTKIFSIILFFLSLQIILQCLKNKKQTLSKYPKANYNIFFGFVIGVISALSGIGGGSLTVPYLNSRQVKMSTAIGCSSVLAMFMAVFGSLCWIYTGLHSHEVLPIHSLGYVYLPALFFIVLASSITAPLGAKLASHISTLSLKICFAILLLIVSITMFLS